MEGEEEKKTKRHNYFIYLIGKLGEKERTEEVE
jgi:hypothetical protein